MTEVNIQIAFLKLSLHIKTGIGESILALKSCTLDPKLTSSNFGSETNECAEIDALLDSPIMYLSSHWYSLA